MTGSPHSSLEIRRILLLARLRSAPKGMTMQQLVRDCGKVTGWCRPGETAWEVVRLVVQSLIDDGLARMTSRFVLTAKGREYIGDPLKWRIDDRTTEEVGKALFWDAIYSVFDKASRRLRPGASSQ